VRAGTVQSQGGRVGNVKQVGFEPRPEDSYGRCGSGKIRQTVKRCDLKRQQKMEREGMSAVIGKL